MLRELNFPVGKHGIVNFVIRHLMRKDISNLLEKDTKNSIRRRFFLYLQRILLQDSMNVSENKTEEQKFCIELINYIQIISRVFSLNAEIFYI